MNVCFGHLVYRAVRDWAWLVAMCGLVAQPISAAETPQDDNQKSAAEIAAELANPNSALGSMNFNFDYVTYAGDLPAPVIRRRCG
ncbi:MAG: hypothetical protein HC814_00240 [Rhodobacteraceae bacterium]|nr:hypothetical protein [Paracoccaceae bacterium]